MKPLLLIVALFVSLTASTLVFPTDSKYSKVARPTYVPEWNPAGINSNIASSQAYDWVELGHNLAAVGPDCPYVTHGPSSTLQACESGCANTTMCNAINYNPSLPDCVFRACSDPKDPQLSRTPGYNVYSIEKSIPPLPSNSSLVQLVANAYPLNKFQGRNITFFGDSITWLDTYITAISDAIQASPATRHLDINLVNRGINGGTILDVKDGGNILGTNYPSFDQALAMDNPAVVAIQIGINDVWWPDRNDSSKLPQFLQVLTGLIKQLQAQGTKVYIATVSVIGEKRDGQDPFDANLDAYAAGQVQVAEQTGIWASNLRKAYLTYDLVYNVDNVYYGILTYDGVHPTGYGTQLLANYHAKGLLSV